MNQNLNPKPRNQPTLVKTIEHTARIGIRKREENADRRRERFALRSLSYWLLGLSY